MQYDNEKTTIKKIKELIDFKNKTALEIGCGQGKTSSLLADDSKIYIGIDTDGQSINDAISKYKNVDFKIGSGESLEFKNSYFDIVLFTLSLHHQNSCLALREAYRVLKNKGRLLIIEPSIDGALQQFFHLFNDETMEITTALKNIMQSRFTLELQDIFNVNARFDNESDLCSYHFSREKIDSGDENLIIEKLNQLQINYQDNKPICIKDRINIYLLIKNENPLK